MTPCGPQAGVHIECLAQAHQAVFILRSAIDLDLIPLRATDCAYQHSVGPGCFVHGIVSAEHPVLIVGCTTQQIMFEIDSKAVRPRGLFQDCDGCVRHFRPDAIAAECQHTEYGSGHSAYRVGLWERLSGVV